MIVNMFLPVSVTVNMFTGEEGKKLALVCVLCMYVCVCVCIPACG